MTALTIIPGLDIATLYQNTRKCGDTKSCCVLCYGASVSYDYLSWPPAVNVLFVQYFGLQPNACKGNDISLSLTSPLHGSNAPRGCFFVLFFFLIYDRQLSIRQFKFICWFQPEYYHSCPNSTKLWQSFLRWLPLDITLSLLLDVTEKNNIPYLKEAKINTFREIRSIL